MEKRGTHAGDANLDGVAVGAADLEVVVHPLAAHLHPADQRRRVRGTVTITWQAKR